MCRIVSVCVSVACVYEKSKSCLHLKDKNKELRVLKKKNINM